MENKNDLRVKKTKDRIKNALIELLENNDINTISITQLCNEAKIQRNTFYNHYDMPEDVLDDLYNEHMNRIVDKIKSCGPLLDYKNMVRETCIIMKQYDKLTKLLFNKKGNFIQMNQQIMNMSNQTIMQIFIAKEIKLNEKDLYFVNRYATGGVLLLLYDWVDNDFNDEIDVLSERINKMSSQLFESFFSHKFI